MAISRRHRAIYKKIMLSSISNFHFDFNSYLKCKNRYRPHPANQQIFILQKDAIKSELLQELCRQWL